MRIMFPLLAAVLVFMTACASTAHRVSGTDVPRVPETEVKSNSLVFSGGRAESGKVEFTGTIYDALERARWTARGFAIDGWTEVSLGGSAAEAKALFTSAWRQPGTERVATLRVIAAQLHGSATITIEVKKISEVSDGSGAKNDTKDDTKNDTKNDAK